MHTFTCHPPHLEIAILWHEAANFCQRKLWVLIAQNFNLGKFSQNSCFTAPNFALLTKIILEEEDFLTAGNLWGGRFATMPLVWVAELFACWRCLDGKRKAHLQWPAVATATCQIISLMSGLQPSAHRWRMLQMLLATHFRSRKSSRSFSWKQRMKTSVCY